MKNEIAGKTPLQVIDGVAAEVCESITLLEIIYRNYELPEEAESAISCLIRSMSQTRDAANKYALMLAQKSK